MINALESSLITTPDGQPTARHHLLTSRDWDEIRHWTDRVYLPFKVQPIGKVATPDSGLYAAQVGGFTLSRFAYGVPMRASEFDRRSDIGLVLTGVHGSSGHRVDGRHTADCSNGDAFVVAISKVDDFDVSFDGHHLQLNLTFPHALLSDFFVRFHGHSADERMWRTAFKLSVGCTAWLALLHYCSQCIGLMPDQVAHGNLGRHLEEMIAAHLLVQWTQHYQGESPVMRRIAPRHVVLAERYLRENARLMPTLTDAAAAAGVSVRSLNAAFREYHSTTPMEVLRGERLAGVRAALLTAPPGATVRAIALEWGYLNLGMFAGHYRKHYGELPSRTLRRFRR